MLSPNLTQSYDYFLPSDKIANKPIYPKSAAKLLVYNRANKSITHANFGDFFSFVPKDCLIVLNDTKVLKARILGHKASGGAIELLYHKNLGENFLVQIKGRVKKNDELIFKNDLSAKILELLENGLRIVQFVKNNRILNQNELLIELENIGQMPIPPYIKRQSDKSDIKYYQSVFAKNIGSIAAPTASLHFSKRDLERIKKLNHCFITLHVGAGTFFEVESSDINHHKMHKENFFIAPDSALKLQQAKKILAIGTTAARCVEFYAKSQQTSGECDIFIHPLNPPRKVDYLLTNFHLPKSSLIMLVAGFIGLETTLEIYSIARELDYRFYSYGDGMLVL